MKRSGLLFLLGLCGACNALLGNEEGVLTAPGGPVGGSAGSAGSGTSGGSAGSAGSGTSGGTGGTGTSGAGGTGISGAGGTGISGAGGTGISGAGGTGISGAGGSSGAAGAGGSVGAGGGSALTPYQCIPFVLASSLPSITDFSVISPDDIGIEGDQTNWGQALVNGGMDVDTNSLWGGFFAYPQDWVADTLLNNQYVVSGGVDTNYSGVGLWFAQCVDASAFSGISFEVSGNPGPSGQMRIMLSTHTNAPIDPVAMRGACRWQNDETKFQVCSLPSISKPVLAGGDSITFTWAELAGGLPIAGSNGAGLTGIQFEFAPLAAPYDVDVTIDNLHFTGGCTGSCPSGQFCVNGECIASPCDGICQSPEAMSSFGDGFRAEPLGNEARCFEVPDYAPTEPAHLLCWELVDGRTLSVNGQGAQCLNGGVVLGPPRAGGYCIEVSPGENDFAGLWLTTP